MTLQEAFIEACKLLKLPDDVVKNSLAEKEMSFPGIGKREIAKGREQFVISEFLNLIIATTKFSKEECDSLEAFLASEKAKVAKVN